MAAPPAMSDTMSSWTKALEFLKTAQAGHGLDVGGPANEASAKEAAAEAASLTSTVPLLESGAATPKSPQAAATESMARLPRPTSPASQVDTSSLPTRSLEPIHPKDTPPRHRDNSEDRQASTPASASRCSDRPTSFRGPSRTSQAPILRQKPSELNLSPTASSPGFARRPKEVVLSPSTPGITPSTPSPHLRRRSASPLTPPGGFQSPDPQSGVPPFGHSPVLRSRSAQAFGSPPALSPAAHKRLLEFNPPVPSQTSDAKNSGQYAELHRRRVELHQLPQSAPRKGEVPGVRRVAERSPSPRVEAPADVSSSMASQTRGMENFRAAWVRVGDLQMRHESFWEAYPDAVRTLDQALYSWLGFSGLPAVEEGLRRANLETTTKAPESHWVQVLLWQEAEISRLLADNARWRTHIKFQEAAGHRPPDSEQLQSQCVSRLIQDLLSMPPQQAQADPEGAPAVSPFFDSPRCHLQDAAESDPFSEKGVNSVCRALLQTGTLPPTARTALRQRGAKVVAKSLLEQVQQLHAQALQRYRAACQAAAAAKLRQTIAKCHTLLQEKARLRASVRAAAPAVEETSVTPRTSLEPSSSRKPRTSSGRGVALDAFGVEACFDNDSLYRPRRSF